MSVLLSPSVLNADYCELGKTIQMLNESEADWIHLDIMDGAFVPNISFGQPIVASIKKIAQKPLDVHLMINEPDRYIESFAQAGADILTVHYEACTHLHRTLELIHQQGVKPAVALNPHTPVAVLEEILPFCHMVLLMTVNPGFGGQKFIAGSFEKVKKLRNLANQINPALLIEVDGGVDNTNAQSLIDSGVNILVSGSYILKSKHPKQTIQELKTI
jgi:ribulose-phosphate 3-epimerase